MTASPTTQQASVIDQIALALFDDHAAMREALASALTRDPGMTVVAAGGSAGEAISLSQVEIPDAVLLDLNMPGGGLSAVQALSRAIPATKLIMLTSEDEAYQVDAALSSGASAYIIKGTPAAEIRRTIRDVMRGKSHVSPSLAASLLGSRPLAAPWVEEGQELPFTLLEREEQILRRLIQGLTSEEIGESIGLSAAAVDAFVSNVLLKVHAAGSLPGV